MDRSIEGEAREGLKKRKKEEGLIGLQLAQLTKVISR